MFKNALILLICLSAIACNTNRNNCDLHFKSKALKKISCTNFFIPRVADLKTAFAADTLTLYAYPRIGPKHIHSDIYFKFTERNLLITEDVTIAKTDSSSTYVKMEYDAVVAWDDKNSSFTLSHIKDEDAREVPPDKLMFPGEYSYKVILARKPNRVLLVKKK